MQLFDLHSHVLPNIDDGAKNADVSLEMLNDAVNQGVSVLAATPHYYGERRSVAEFLADREKVYHSVLEKAQQKRVKLPEILLGAEVYLTRGLSARENLEKLSVGSTNTVLIELPFQPWEGWVYREIERIFCGAGLMVMLAHPERYIHMPWDIKKFYPLVEMGAVLQINADTVLNRARLVRKLVQIGCPCVLGSDSHNMQDRRSKMEAAMKAFARLCGDSAATQMLETVKNMGF